MQKGFTLLEIVLVLGILTVLAVMSVGFLQSFRVNSELDAAARNSVDILRRAQNNSLTGENFLSWGATFNNPSGSGGDFFRWYSCAVACDTSGACADASETEKDRYPLSSGLAYTAPSENTTTDICFEKRTGAVQGAARTIIIQSAYDTSITRTISVSSEGKTSID